MEKFKRFLYENKKAIISFGILIALTVILCIPKTMDYLVSVFGWAAWFYLVLGYTAAILHTRKKSVNLSPKLWVFLVLSLVFLIATLHVAFIDKNLTKDFANYIIGSYTSKTAGGAIFGILTSPVVVWCTYIGAIVIFIVLTAIFLFLFLRPFIFAGTANPFVIKKKKVDKKTAPKPREIILDEAPFLKKKKPATKPVPVAFETDKSALEEEMDPKKLLFGVVKEEYVPNDSLYQGGGDYDVSHYVFKKKEEPKEEVDKEKAAEILFGNDNEDVLNFDDEDEEETVIFDDEKDENIPDLLKPRNNNSAFLQALKQRANGQYAPSPIVYGEAAEEDEEDFEVEENEEENQTEDFEIEESETIDEEIEDNFENEETELSFEENEETELEEIEEVEEIEEDVEAEKPRVHYNTTPGINIDEKITENIVPRHIIVQEPEKPKVTVYNKPPISLLKTHETPNFTPFVDNMEELEEIFNVKLRKLGVSAELKDAIKGPTTTLCAIKLADDCPIAKLHKVKEDLQRFLKSTRPVAIVSQLPGTDYCGVQIPNNVKGVVGFKEVLVSKEYREAKGDLVIALGKSAEGDILIEDLAAMPHALVAGETGSGKSVCLNVMLASIIYRYSPDEVKLILIDLKEVEMSVYSGIPHMMFKEPLLSIPAIVNALKWVRKEVSERFAMFKSMHLRDFNEYNKKEGVEKIPRIVIIIDEASELMSDNNARKELEETLVSLARIARAAGIHLVFATQNPIKAVITNEIQANLNTKIAFAVGDRVNSQVIFKANGAECLLGKGDMFIKRGQEMKRAQCAYVSTEELQDVTRYIRENNECVWDEKKIEKILNGNITEADGNTVSVAKTNVQENNDIQMQEEDANAPDINWKALKICVDSNYVSCSYLQRKLKKGYNTVANILEELAADGYITQVPQGSKEKREILISKEDFYKEWEERFGQDEDYELEKINRDMGDNT